MPSEFSLRITAESNFCSLHLGVHLKEGLLQGLQPASHDGMSLSEEAVSWKGAELCWRRRTSTPKQPVPEGATSRFSSPWASTGTGHFTPVCAINLETPRWQVKPVCQLCSKGLWCGSLILFKSTLLFPWSDPLWFCTLWRQAGTGGSRAASFLPIC